MLYEVITADSRSATVGNLNVAAVKVVVSEYRAANRTNHYAAILNAEVVHCFGDKFVDDAVSATCAVVGGSRGKSALSGEFLI